MCPLRLLSTVCWEVRHPNTRRVSLAGTSGPLSSQGNVCDHHATSSEPGERAALGKPWPALFQAGAVTRDHYDTLILNTVFYTDLSFLSWCKATAFLSRCIHPLFLEHLLTPGKRVSPAWQRKSMSLETVCSQQLGLHQAPQLPMGAMGCLCLVLCVSLQFCGLQSVGLSVSSFQLKNLIHFNSFSEIGFGLVGFWAFETA